MQISTMTNLVSLNTIRQNREEINSSMERLTTGKRINSASDNPADLAQTSRLAAQIASLKAATKNANNAMSLLETADATLEEIGDTLQRIRELAVQASSSSITATERSVLTEEKNQLSAAIDAFANTAKFNGENILNGNYQGKNIQVGPNSGDTMAISIAPSDSSVLGAYALTGATRGALGPAATVSTSGSPFTVNNTTDSEDIALANASGSYTIDVSDADSAKVVATKFNSISSTTGVTATAETYALLRSTDSNTYTISVNGTSTSSFAISTSDVSAAVTAINLISSTTGVTATATTDNKVLLADADGDDITIENADSDSGLRVFTVGLDQSTTAGSEVSLAAANSTDSTRIVGTLRLTSDNDFSVTQSGTSSQGYVATGSSAFNTLSNVSFTSATDAADSLAILDGSINQISAIRGTVGALDNRLDHRVSLLTRLSETETSAKALIEDADFAVESAKLAKALVLQRANASLIAQANASADLVLTLIED